MDKKTDLFCAKLSRASYPRVGMGAFTNIPMVYLQDHKTDTQLYVLYKDETCYVVYRGTEKKLKDIITDILFRKVEIPYDGVNKKVKVHKGFLRSYKSVRSKVLETIKQFNPKKVIFTGHSLGGVTALLSALDYQYLNPEKTDVIKLVTFGQPKLGNRALVKSIQGRLVNYCRYVNKGDFVTTLAWWFKHAGKKIKTTLRGHSVDNYVKFLEEA